MDSLPSYPMSWLVGLSLVLIFVGERLLAPASYHWGISGFGLLLIAIAIALRALRASAVKDGRRYMETRLLGLYVVIALGEAIALWLTNSVSVREHEKLSVVLTALFPALILAGLLPVIFGEVSYASTARAETVERGRLRDAMFSGLGLAFLLIFAFSAYYVASERDVKADLSFYRAAKAGPATIQIVRGLEEPVTVTTFFPPANEVGATVQDYLSTLQKESPNFKVVSSDVALEPAKAKELGVSGNGVVLLTKAGRKEQLLLGTDFENARSDLAKFDGDFQRRLLAVSRNKRTVYLVSGHGERSEERPQSGDTGTTIRTFKDLVESQNLTVKRLTSVEGLGNEVPSDATAVMVIGPTKSLAPEEAAAITRYFQKGGKVLYALEPGKDVDTAELLAPLGLKLLPDVLASDIAYVAQSRRPSDREIIKTASYSSHPSMNTLSLLGSRGPMGFWGAGALEATADKPKDVTFEFTVHAHESTWNDVNGNFVYDAGPEVRKKWELAAAVRSGDGRAIVVGDADVFSDIILTNEPNYYYALDSLKWLLGDEASVGAISNQQDVPIQHTRQQDVFWFYSTIFLAPAAVLAFGYFASRRRPKRAPRSGGKS